jgi:predicted O-linked N-acetylglucosamine transferase (SPINDLY family)
LRAVDYRLSDPHLDPPGGETGKYVEETFRLPETFWCIDPMSDEPVGDLPALANGHVTFGCLNNFAKINDGVLLLWSRVMRGVPGSRLLLLAPRGRRRDEVAEFFARNGVTRERVEFVDVLPRPD